MSAKSDVDTLIENHGSTVLFHRNDSLIPCPCRTPEGFRDPIWHIQNPAEPVCNEAGMLPDPEGVGEFQIKAFVQPVQSGAVRRLTTEQVIQIFGEIQTDDHLGIFPTEWAGKIVNFYDWGLAGEDFVLYNSRKYTAVSINLIPDPETGNPYHHWEIGLRLVGS